MYFNLNIGGSKSKERQSERDESKEHQKYENAIKVKTKLSEETNYFDEYKKKLDQWTVEFVVKWRSKNTKKDSMSLNDFEMLRTLGVGAFGRVKLVKHKLSSAYYAMKILEKRKLMKTKQVEHTLNEKRVLQCVDFPFLIKSTYFFKDNSYLYMILPFMNGGELFSYLTRKTRFRERQGRFYASQVVLALEYLHCCGLVYRDLKPENILLDCEGYIKIADFGFCKYIEGRRTWTMCGTPEYLAPELLLSTGYSKSVDWWAFGVLLYEMTAGQTPFVNKNQMKMYERIIVAKYKCPLHFSGELKDLIKNLLQPELSRRFGNLRNGAIEVKQHKWFASIDWDRVYKREIRPSYIPVIKSDSDAGNFDACDEEELKIESKDYFLKEFADF